MCVRSEFRIVMPVTISVLFYYVSVRSEFRFVMPVIISVLFYYVSVRSEFRIVNNTEIVTGITIRNSERTDT